MKMFRNDYSEICHKKVLEALNDALNEQNVGYGLDKHSENAKKMIQSLIKNDNASVHFLVGGTQTNMTMISYALKDYEAVIAVATGHINVHETGSIESSGHKILTVTGENGKIRPADIKDVIKNHVDEHMVKPKMVYISNSTEIGTIYKKDELEAIYKICKENNLYLFIDGARLASALTSKDNDLTIKDVAKNCDSFYLGGTKNGLMFGEALVIINDSLKEDFRFQIKNKGAMLAKGFISGIEFEAILKDNLYFEIAKVANDNAYLLSRKLKELGFKVDEVYTNQVFVTCSNNEACFITNNFGCELWRDLGEEKQVRFVTSFSTRKEDVIELYNTLKKYLNK